MSAIKEGVIIRLQCTSLQYSTATEGCVSNNYFSWMIARHLIYTSVWSILECQGIVNYSKPSLRTQFKVAAVYSIHTQSLSWCSAGLAPNVLLRRVKTWVSPVQWIEPHRILAPTLDLNQGPPGPQSRVLTTVHHSSASDSIKCSIRSSTYRLCTR